MSAPSQTILAARQAIAGAISSVCSDGNSDPWSVALDVLIALNRAGFVLEHQPIGERGP